MAINFDIYHGLPAVTALWAEPMPSSMTACHELVWSQPILGCLPVGCHSWGHSQQRVVLAQTVVGAVRALTVHILPDIDAGHPFMWQPTWALVTNPPYAHAVAGCDLPVSQMLIFGMMPLLLQLWPQEADAGAC